MNDDDMPQWIPATHFSDAKGGYIKADMHCVIPIDFKLYKGGVSF